jgi:hypothetical protein
MQQSLPDIDTAGIKDKHLADQITQILNFVEWQAKQISKLTIALEQANQEIARLKGQPKKPQFASKKKPSISVTEFLSEKSDKKTWQKKAKEVPIDQYVSVPEQEVCSCGSHEFRSIRTKTKVVQGMLIQRNNIAYHGREKQCVNCGKIYKATFPQETKGLSFDGTIQTLTSHLKFDGRFSHRLLHRFFTGFGVQISYGEITAILKRNNGKLIPAMHHLRSVGIKQSKYTQSDATGTKRRFANGTIINQHINILGHKFLSIFKITRKYNAMEMNKLLGVQGRKKPLVSDDGSPNNACRCKGLQLCWVHEIRLYKKLFPFFNGHRELQEQTLFKLRKFYHLAKQYGADPPKTATPEKRLAIEKMFDEITTQTTGYVDLDKQLKLTRRKRDKLLYFLDHPYLPIQNNQCEQDLREYVIIRKISGATNSIAGDRSIERHLSVIQTTKKQGLSVFYTLHGLLTGQLSPAILTVKSV